MIEQATIQSTPTSSLHDGVAAAKRGDKELARQLLGQAAEQNPRSEIAWLWLASVTEPLDERLNYLNQVLELNPTNEHALAWAAAAKKSLFKTLLHKGAAAAKAGDRGEAYYLILQATEHDPTNELGWLWLASVAESPQDRLAYVERVLQLNPANERALALRATSSKQLARALLQMAAASSKAGDREQARATLQDALGHDPRFEEGWIWQAYLTDEPLDKISCYEIVLEINPANERAAAALSALRAQLAAPTWHCPLCLAEDADDARTSPDQERRACRACGAVLALDDLDALTGNHQVDVPKMREAIARLLVTATQEDDWRLQHCLGLAHLNLRQTADGLTHLEAALRLNPADEKLRRAVAELSARQAAEAVAAARVGQHQERGRNEQTIVMIVDDSPTVRKLVTIKLEKHGHRVVAASDGMEALTKLQEEVPDLVLLDINMPRLDGYQLCKLIKSNEATKHVPVVMLSGKDGFFDKMRGRVAGSTAYMTKPFDPETLIHTVNEYCKRPA